jgi:hypothetical protein
MRNSFKYKIQQACSRYKLAVFFLAITFFTFTAMAITNTDELSQNKVQLTVAKVFDKKINEDYTQIIFLESARFYKVFTNNTNYKSILALSKKSEKGSVKLWVEFTEVNGDIIKAMALIKKK